MFLWDGECGADFVWEEEAAGVEDSPWDTELARTVWSSLVSSASLSKMPSTLCQSKPMRAALRVS